ncbi:MAG: aminotransferase class I/II-fold pyridoxal phosphate-dependent enzyme [bacterium]
MRNEFPRIKRLPPYVFNIVNELKSEARRRGEDIIDFGMGNPDQPTPPHIVEKLVEVAQRKNTHRYSQSSGILRLRQAICNWYGRRFGVELDPETEAVVSMGSKEGLAHLALAVAQSGDVVLVPNPTYPIHTYSFVIAGADIRHVPIEEDNDFFSELENAIRHSWPRPKFLVLNFPANPTTQCVDLSFFEKVISIAKEQKIWVIHDLAYADIGWQVKMPQATMFVWAKIPQPFAKHGSLEFAKLMLREAKVAVSPGVGFGEYGDAYVRFALIENEHRIRQAVRGLKHMFG